MLCSEYLQGDTSGRGKALVVIKVGSSDYQLSCWAAIVTSGTYNEMLNKTFSVTRRVTLYVLVVDLVFESRAKDTRLDY